jgi:hypothetical protein
VFPEHTTHRRRHQARTSDAVFASGGWKRTGPVGGHRSAMAVPASRPHMRQLISAMNTRRRPGPSGFAASTAAVVAEDGVAVADVPLERNEAWQKAHRSGSAELARQNTMAPQAQARRTFLSEQSGTTSCLVLSTYHLSLERPTHEPGACSGIWCSASACRGSSSRGRRSGRPHPCTAGRSNCAVVRCRHPSLLPATELRARVEVAEACLPTAHCGIR